MIARVGMGLQAGLLLAAGALALPACGGGDGGGGSEVMSPCGFNEPAANQSFASAASFDLGSDRMGCLTAADAAGADFWAFDAPGDAGGGYVQVQVDASGAGKLRAVIYGDDAATELGRVVAPDAATPLSFFVATAPGARYRVAVQDDAGFAAPYGYRLTTGFTAVGDAYEPNDTLADAKPIDVGAPVDAFLFAGGGATDPLAALDDDYRVSMAGGQMMTVRLESMPTTMAGRLFLYGPDGVEVARISTGHKGEALTLLPPLPAVGGDYVVRVALFSDPPPAVVDGATPPASFTQPYRLTVTQP